MSTQYCSTIFAKQLLQHIICHWRRSVHAYWILMH